MNIVDYFHFTASLVNLIEISFHSSGPDPLLLGQSSCTLQSNLREQTAPTWGWRHVLELGLLMEDNTSECVCVLHVCEGRSGGCGVLLGECNLSACEQKVSTYTQVHNHTQHM